MLKYTSFFFACMGWQADCPQSRAQFIRALSSARCAPAHTHRTTKTLNVTIQKGAPPQVLNEKLFSISKLVLISMNGPFVLADFISMSNTGTL